MTHGSTGSQQIGTLQQDRFLNSPRKPRPAQAGLIVSIAVSVATNVQRIQYGKPFDMVPAPRLLSRVDVSFRRISRLC